MLAWLDEFDRFYVVSSLISSSSSSSDTEPVGNEAANSNNGISVDKNCPVGIQAQQDGRDGQTNDIRYPLTPGSTLMQEDGV